MEGLRAGFASFDYHKTINLIVFLCKLRNLAMHRQSVKTDVVVVFDSFFKGNADLYLPSC